MTNPSPDTSAVEPATAELVRRLLSLADPSAEAMDDDKRLTLLIHAANDAAKALSFPAMTSPDTSAAEVVAWRVEIVTALSGLTRFSRDTNLSGEYLASLVEPIITSLLDTSRAETAAANARAEAAVRERDETVLGSMLDIYRQRAEVDADQMAKLEAKLAKAVEALEIVAGKRQCVDGLMGNQDVAVAVLAEIEGKSK